MEKTETTIMISTDFASIEMDKTKKHLIVKAKTPLGANEMNKIINVVVKETDTRALDVAHDWTMDVENQNGKKEEAKK